MQKVHALIGKIQAQPLETRKALLVGMTVTVTAVIVILWGLSLVFFGRTTTYQSSDQSNVATESPFKLVSDSVVEIYASAVQGYDNAVKK